MLFKEYLVLVMSGCDLKNTYVFIWESKNTWVLTGSDWI